MFSIALRNVLVTLLYILPGFLLGKLRRASADHLSTLSSFLIYVCSPCMLVSTFLTLEFSVNQLKEMLLFMVVTLLLQSLFMLALYLLFRRKYADAQYRVCTIGSVMGNVGFFGLPIVRALLPSSPIVMCYSSMYVISMNILSFTVGVFCLTTEKKYMSVKPAVLNPSTFGLLVGMLLYVTSLSSHIPDVLSDAVVLLGSMTTPICMTILGIRLSAVVLKKLFIRPMIYLTCLGKLVLFPLFCYAAVAFLPLSDAFKASVLILSATPCASVILTLAEMHRKETELAANCVLVSTLLCFVTIPLLVMIL